MAKNTAHILTEFLKHAKNFWTVNKDTNFYILNKATKTTIFLDKINFSNEDKKEHKQYSVLEIYNRDRQYDQVCKIWYPFTVLSSLLVGVSRTAPSLRF